MTVRRANVAMGVVIYAVFVFPAAWGWVFGVVSIEEAAFLLLLGIACGVAHLVIDDD
jgi:hypothetical protein